MDIKVIGGEMSKDEINAYVSRAQELYKGREIERMEISLDGEYVDLNYYFKTVPFDRIRRITGYLVGTTQRFNNAKRAEERDRIKHDVG